LDAADLEPETFCSEDQEVLKFKSASFEIDWVWRKLHKNKLNDLLYFIDIRIIKSRRYDEPGI
jgi:hypothetical protein